MSAARGWVRGPEATGGVPVTRPREPDQRNGASAKPPSPPRQHLVLRPRQQLAQQGR